jgi:stress-induced morphogen
MPARVEKPSKETKSIEKLLKGNFKNHPPQYPPSAYRYNSASIRVRIVDESFRGKSKLERQELVLPVLEKLPDETQSDITILLLLAPEEVDQSMMNLEFENPTPSTL